MRNKIPPPIVAIIAALLMLGVSMIFPEAVFSLPYVNVFGSIFMALSIAIMTAGILEFRRASTTINPLIPDSASELVSTGIFHYSRNPMYLGMVGILTGIFFYLSNFASALIIPIFISFIYQYQIKPEEEAMKKLFSSSFEDYCHNVRRWV